MLGHAIQVLHILVLMFFLYLFAVDEHRLAVSVTWIIVCIIPNLVFGICPLTWLADQAFRQSGHVTYINLYAWMTAIAGRWYAPIIEILMFLIPFAFGIITKRKKRKPAHS